MLGSFKLLRQLFSTYKPRNTQPRQPPRPLSIYQSHKIFASQLLSSISQTQLLSLYFNRPHPASFHHSITLSKLLSFYKLNPPSSYFTKQLSTILTTISSQLDNLDPDSLVSVLNSLADFPMGDHEELLNLQRKILEIVVGEDDLQGVDKITVLKLVSACRRVNRFQSEHERIIEVIKVCLRKIANSIKKLSTRNIMSLIGVIEQYQIYTNNTEKALCRQAINRIVYLSVKEKILLIKGVTRVKSKQMMGKILESVGIENLKGEDPLEDIVELVGQLEQMESEMLKELTGSDIQGYEKYIVKHALKEYLAKAQIKELVSLSNVDKILSICQKYSLHHQLSQLLSILSTHYPYIKVQSRLPLVLFQLSHSMPITINLLKTTQKKSKAIFPLMFKILEYPSSSHNYSKIPQFQYLANLSIRYFIHNIAKYPTQTQLRRCKCLAMLFLSSPAAYETFIKLIGKYLVEHTKYSQETIEYLSSVRESSQFPRFQSYEEAVKGHSLDGKVLGVIQKMTSVVDLMYYTICIVGGMDMRVKDGEGNGVNQRILREIASEFVKNLRLGYYPEFVTWDILRKLGLVESYFGRKITGIKEIGEYYQRIEPESDGEKVKQTLKDLREGELYKNINGVRATWVGKDKAYILSKQPIQEPRCASLEQILLKQSGISLQFLHL